MKRKVNTVVKLSAMGERGTICDECDQPLPVGVSLADMMLEFGPPEDRDFKMVCPGKCRMAAEARLCQA